MTPPGERGRRRPSGKSALEFALMLAVCFALVFGFIRPVVAAPVYVSSGSMIPTLGVLDRVFVNKLADDFSSPERGEIFLFEDPANGPDPLIKRVIGVSGDEVELRVGKLFLNGEPQNEPYVNQQTPDTRSFGPVTVPEGYVFVMGDNRSNSLDSRFFGPISEDDLIGEAVFRFWPVGRIGAV